ncbi:MAG: translocation/assembly module TamB domain-containing protein [Pseudomonadota bacterium]
MRRVLTSLVRIGLLLSLVAVVALGALIATETGTRALLRVVDGRVSALTLGDARGRLWSGLTVDQVDYQEGDTVFSARELDLRWRLSCLLERVLCLDLARASRLSLRLPAASPEADDTAPQPVSLPTVSLPIGVRLGRLDLAQFTYEQGATAVALRDIDLAGAARASQLRVDTLALDWTVGPLDGALSVSGDVELRDAYPLALDIVLRHNAADVGGQQLPAGALTVTLGNTLEDLDVAASLDGAATASLVAKVHPVRTPLWLDASLAIAHAQWPVSGPADVVATSTDLRAAGHLDALAWSLTTAVAHPAWPTAAIEAGGELDTGGAVRDGALSVSTAAGDAELEWHANWGDSPAFAFDAVITDVNPGVVAEEAEGRIGGTLAVSARGGDAWVVDRADAALTGTLRERPVRLDGTVSVDNDTVRIGDTGLSLEVGANRVLISGSAGDTVDLAATLDLPELSHVLPDLGGVVRGTVNASGERLSPTADVALTVDGLRYTGVAVDRLTVDGAWVSGGQLASNATVRWQGLALEGGVTNDGSVALRGTEVAHTVDITVRGEPASATVSGSGAFDGAVWAGEVSTGSVTAGGRQWRSDTTIALRVADGAVTVGAHCWGASPARLCLDDAARLAAQGHLDLRVERVPVDWATAALADAIALEGWINGALQSAWTASSAPSVQGAVSIDALEARVPSTDGETVALALGRVSVDATTGADAAQSDHLQLSLRTAGGALGDGRVDARVPLGAASDYDATVRWSALDLASVHALVPELDQLAGVLGLDARVRGTDTGPRVDGQLVLSGGDVRGLDLPTELADAELTVTLDGDSARFDGGWRSPDGGDGTVRLQGDAAWTGGLRADLRVDGTGVPVDVRPWVVAAVSPALSLSVSDDRVRVRGAVVVDEADIEIVAPEAQAPTPSRDAVIVDVPEDDGAPRSGGQVLDVDVDVQLGDAVYLRGFGFDSRLGGLFEVRLNAAQPVQLFGDLQILDGRYKAWGQDLSIQRGEIVFAGLPGDAVVDATAWRELTEVRAGLDISGKVTSPTVAVISEPAMPDQEALSYLVLGRAWDEAGDQQAAITRAALSLGLKRSGGLTDRVASGLGIQSLSVEAQGSGDDTAAVVNAQLNDKLSVQYGVGVFTPIRTLTARYQLGRQLYVEAVQGVESALDFMYSFEF